MKIFLLIPMLTLSLQTLATTNVFVDSGTARTVPGVGGTAQIAYAFAKGDVITIDATAEKQLQLVLAYMHPQMPVLGRAKHTRDAGMTFTMPEDGIAVIRFISDRSGANHVRYTISRMPASDAVQNYNTRVVWQKPASRAGGPVPKREGAGGVE